MEKIEYYTVKPNLKQVFGRKVTKEMEFDEKTEDGKVHQTLKDCVLTTHIYEKNEHSVYGLSEKVVVEEESKITQTLPEGTIIVWSEESGYIIPTFQMCTLDELIEDAKAVKEIYEVGEVKSETKGNEG